eukprot:CAMPEP_0197026334 /NCGR_PEP_ID=MMETSP1384-20130603/6444_1 /TAXON_ID=29189 /ORGANISM="Ammonia sp." /LENGTH=266 /DNA_ID=CAMNT_0042454977 /DNA_START=32 /DNA_END=832 /DNA_ORIENTATION=+
MVFNTAGICCLSLLFLCNLAAPPTATIPFVSVEAAQEWVDAMHQEYANFFNRVSPKYTDSEQGFNEAYGTLWDAATIIIDGEQQASEKFKAQRKQIRSKAVPDTVSFSCTVDATDFNSRAAADRTQFTANCRDTGQIESSLIGKSSLDTTSTKTYIFNADGTVAEHRVQSPTAGVNALVFKTIFDALVTEEQAANGDADFIVFEIGSLKLDRIDVVLLAAFAIFTSVIGLTLCCILKRVNAMYQYLMPRNGKKAKYAHVSSTDPED